MAFDEVASSPLELIKLKSITGGLSSSLMISVCTTSDPRVALTGLDKVIMIVSSISSNKSLIISVIVIVPVVAPLMIVSVPLEKV